MTKKDEQTSESTERVKTDSDHLRDTISARHREERNENMKGEGIDAVDTSNLSQEITGKAPEPDKNDGDPGDKESRPDQEDETTAKADDEGDVDKKGDVDDTMTIKVDGVETQVSKQDIEDAGGVRAYQTNAAADRRLEESKQVLVDAKAEAAKIKGGEGKPSTTKSTGSDEVSQEELAVVVNAMQYGTEEEGTKALSDLVNNIKGSQHTTQDANEIAGVVRSQIDFDKAMQTFKTDYPDIFSNKRLMQMAQQIDNEQIDSGDKRTYSERYADIGKELSGFVGTKNADDTKKQSEANDKRQSKKESVDTSPAPAGSGSRSSSVKDDTPKRTSPRDTIAAMAASRAGGSG